MRKPLEVTYDVAEVEGLTEAAAIMRRLSVEVVDCLPAWTLIYRASKSIQQRQKEVLAASLSDPEAA